MRYVVIIGASGQLGTDLRRTLGAFKVTGLTHSDLDVCDAGLAREVLSRLRPDVVINTSAFNRVDECQDRVAPAFAVNSTGPYHLACLAEEFAFTLVHLSTDYVFDGQARSPYTEDATPNPLNVYGISKLAGESLVRSSCERHFVIRTSGLYGVAGMSGGTGNFVETMIRLGRPGQPVRVVNDQILTPTATADLAAAIAQLVEREGQPGVAYGLYHVTNGEQCSWHEFAKTIFELSGMTVDLSVISSADFAAKARRPAYSVLDNSRWHLAGFTSLQPWRAALTDYLQVTGRLGSERDDPNRSLSSL